MSKAHRDPTASTKAPTASSTASTGRRSRPSSSPAPSTSATVEGAGRARGRGVRYNWVLGAVVPDDAGSTSSASSSPPLPPARSNGRPASARSASPALPPEDASCAAGRDQEEPEQGKKRKRRSKKAQNNAGAAAPPLALPSSSSPSPAPFSAAAAPLTSSRSTLPSVVLPTNRGTLVTIEPALHYLHLLARDPTLTNIQLERRYQREVLSWREMPQPRSERSQGRGGQRKRQRQAAAASSASYASAAPALPPLSLPTPPRPPPPFLLPSSTSTFPFQSSGLHIHPSLQTPASPPPPFFPHMLDPLLIPPPLPRRRKPVDRCTSPSHFLMTPLTLTPYGPDESIDLPVRSRMDDLLLSVLAGFFTPRLVMSEDVGKVWMDADAVVGVGFTPRAYGSLERLLSPLRKRRPRERWSLKEVAAFELGICLHGKDFHKVHQLVSRPQSEVGSKSTSEVVEFYYSTWKHSAHYDRWKSSGRPPHTRLSSAHSAPTQRTTIVISDDEDTSSTASTAAPHLSNSSSTTLSSTPSPPSPCPPSPSLFSDSPSAATIPPTLTAMAESYPPLLQVDAVVPAPLLAPNLASPLLTVEDDGNEHEKDGHLAWMKAEKASLSSEGAAESNGVNLDESGGVIV